MPRYLKYIWKLTLRQKKRFGALFSLMVLAVCVRLTEPYLYKVIVDVLTEGLMAQGFTDAQTQTLITAVGIWFFIAVFLNVANAQVSFLSWLIGNQNSQVVHMDGYQRLLRLDYEQHSQRHSRELTDIIDDADTSMWELTSWWTNRFMSALLGFTGMLIIALTVSWQMTLIALAVVPPGLWFIIHSITKYESEQRRANKLWKEKHEHLSDQVTNILTFKLNPYEHLFLERQYQYVKRAQDAQDNLNKKWRLVEMLNPDVLARFLVMGTGIFFVKSGDITLGTLFMFMGLLNEILIPLHLLGDILPQYSRRVRYMDRYLELMERPDAILIAPQAQKPVALKGSIEFQNVSFYYSADGKDSFALEDISFTIDPGETAAVVGHSGSGKTTITTLLNRLRDPVAGHIMIDGIDLTQFDPEHIKRFIGTVLQENAMYNDTVAANIAYGLPGATREQIYAAAERAHAHDFIQKLSQGYETLIGERGIRLSGGEKQRLAIARAMLKDPKIVVLDEPTSALDSITEQYVQKGLNELTKGRTTLIIAHRLSTVRHADFILVMAGGRIVGRGTHHELMENCAVYKQMVDLQVEGFLADE